MAGRNHFLQLRRARTPTRGRSSLLETKPTPGPTINRTMEETTVGRSQSPADPGSTTATTISPANPVLDQTVLHLAVGAEAEHHPFLENKHGETTVLQDRPTREVPLQLLVKHGGTMLREDRIREVLHLLLEKRGEITETAETVGIARAAHGKLQKKSCLYC